jgi:hypothetical protein
VQHKCEQHEEHQEEVLVGCMERPGAVFAGDSNGKLKGNREAARVQR